MFDFIEGEVIEVNEDYLVLKNNSIGYKIFIFEKNFWSSQKNSQIKVFIHQHINEQENSLFGFSNAFIRDFFQVLISVSGIGPKLAIKILKNQNPYQFLNDIRDKNISNLKTIKGLGEKTAKRILLETNQKIEEVSLKHNHELIQKATPIAVESTIQQEVRQALIRLGYKEYEIRKSMEKVLYQEEKITQLEDFLKECLKELS